MSDPFAGCPVDSVDAQTLLRLDNALQTLREMLIDRGYDLKSVRFPKITQVKRWTDFDSLTFAVKANADSNTANRPLLVFFPNEAKVGVAAVRDMVAEMDANRVSDAIVIVRNGLTSAANSLLVRMCAARGATAASVPGVGEENAREAQPMRSKKTVDIFTLDELQFNITTHEWVPTHIVLSKHEKETVCRRYRAREDQMPGLSARDPVARYYGLRRGQMVFVLRNSETACTAEYYRIVRN